MGFWLNKPINYCVQVKNKHLQSLTLMESKCLFIDYKIFNKEKMLTSLNFN